MKYKIYRIWIIGNKAWRTEVFTDNLEKFRNETADTFKVSKSKIKFCFEINEEW